MPETNDAFGPQMPGPRKQPLTFTGKQKVLAIIAGLIVVAVLAWITISIVLPTEGMKQKASYESCVEDALSQLRDPDSAKFDLTSDTMENDAGETVYTFDGHVRSRNGFGGMNSNTMACLGRWDDDKGEADMKAIILPS